MTMSCEINCLRRHKIVQTTLMVVSVLTVSCGLAFADPVLPEPTPEHAWIQQFVGEWESETECMAEPGQPPVKSTGREVVRPLGEFWTVSEITGTMLEQPFTGNFTLGYDARKEKFIGTWVDNMTGTLWQYEGVLDEDGKTLTLTSEGVCPMNPGKISKFKETLRVEDENHKVFTSAVQGEDGEWVTMMTSHAWRKETAE